MHPIEEEKKIKKGCDMSKNWKIFLFEKTINKVLRTGYHLVSQEFLLFQLCSSTVKGPYFAPPPPPTHHVHDLTKHVSLFFCYHYIYRSLCFVQLILVTSLNTSNLLIVLFAMVSKHMQAMNFFAGLLLLLMPEENAFW